MYVADEWDQCYIFCIYIVFMCLGILGGWQVYVCMYICITNGSPAIVFVLTIFKSFLLYVWQKGWRGGLLPRRSAERSQSRAVIRHNIPGV